VLEHDGLLRARAMRSAMDVFDRHPEGVSGQGCATVSNEGVFERGGARQALRDVPAPRVKRSEAARDP
jgi:hypothetical protein